MAKYIFGIDLGTTYSCIAYVDESGKAVTLKNMEGEYTTPSVVSFEGPEKVIVGAVAKENSTIYADTTVSKVKPLMGRSTHAFTYNAESKSPEEISAYILRKLAHDAGEQLETEVKDVVITCPAYFGTAERTATKTAGEIAGLNVIEIISEPTAAALLYGCNKVKEGEEKNVLVYDLGGGTFDVTVMHIAAGEIEVACQEGDHELGGKDWDERIMKYLTQKFQEETKCTEKFDSYARQKLELDAEAAKKQLTAREKTSVVVEMGMHRARVELTRETFESISEDLLNQTLEKTADAIETVRQKGLGIDEIILVGGSTRMPQVPKALEERFGIKPKPVLDPDEAVAQGAAIYALCAYDLKVKEFQDAGETQMNGDSKSMEPPTVDPKRIPGLRGSASIRDAITVAATKSYALEVLVDGKDLRCDNIILKNTPMREGVILASKQYGTVDDGQEDVELCVYESDFTEQYFDVDQDFLLGKALLKMEGNLPAGSPVQVTFRLDREGILQVTGRDMTTGREISVDMQARPGTTLTQEEVTRIKEKSKRIAVE